MGEKGLNNNIFMVDARTGEKIHICDDVNLLSQWSDDIEPIYNVSDTFTIELTNDIENLFIKPNDNIYKSLEMTFTYPVQIQAKQHKKRRINKKWLKRYGYKTIYNEGSCNINNATITDNRDGTFSFSGETRSIDF